MNKSDFELYQEGAVVTMNKELNFNEKLLNCVVGMCGETGEVADIVKKHEFQGHELNVELLIEEIGDVMWYIANLCETIEVGLGDVCQMNLDKLQKRYNGSFDAKKSIERVDHNECETINGIIKEL